MLRTQNKCVYRSASFKGGMFKRAGERHVRTDPTLVLLDSVPRPVTTYRGVIVRKARS